jgi:hypothetical protein
MFNRTVALISSSVSSAIAAMTSYNPMALIIQQIKNQFYRDPSAFERSSLRVRTGMRYPHSSYRQNRRDAKLVARMTTDLEPPTGKHELLAWIFKPRMNKALLIPHIPANSGPGMEMDRPSRQQLRRASIDGAKRIAKNVTGSTSNWRAFMPPKAEVQA